MNIKVNRTVVFLQRLITIIFILVGIMLAGCGKSTLEPSPNVSGVKVNVFAKTAQSAALSKGAINSVQIFKAGLVIGSVKLETAGIDSTQDFSSIRSRIVELNLQGQAVAMDTIEVTPGTYKEVEISIDKLETGNPEEDPLIALRPEFANASVVIEGLVITQSGASEAFMFKTDLDRDMEIDINPFLEILQPVDGQPLIGYAVSIIVETGRWFVDSGGAWLDPRDPSNKSPIESNIQLAFEAFEDANEDGEPD